MANISICVLGHVVALSSAMHPTTRSRAGRALNHFLFKKAFRHGVWTNEQPTRVLL